MPVAGVWVELDNMSIIACAVLASVEPRPHASAISEWNVQ